MRKAVVGLFVVLVAAFALAPLASDGPSETVACCGGGGGVDH